MYSQMFVMSALEIAEKVKFESCSGSESWGCHTESPRPGGYDSTEPESYRNGKSWFLFGSRLGGTWSPGASDHTDLTLRGLRPLGILFYRISDSAESDFSGISNSEQSDPVGVAYSANGLGPGRIFIKSFEILLLPYGQSSKNILMSKL
jgi:hypothetical protein